jgi:hypothetical protein
MWLVLLMAAQAAECDSTALRSEVEEASPVAIARAYIALAECDTNKARTTAPSAFARMLSGKDGNEAAVHALNAGARDAVDGWLDRLDRGEKTSAIRALGAQCEHDAVADFLVGVRDDKGEAFWTDRWYRGLADCRTPAVQTLLSETLTDPSLSERDNRSRFFGLLEVYARNLGNDAIESLERLATTLSDEQERALVVRAYGDAVQVGGSGSSSAADPKVATESLFCVAPVLRPSNLPTLRETLVAIGSPEAAESVAAYRWPERLQEGVYTYRATAIESVTCKNGKIHNVFHYGDVHEAGTMWPDTMSAQLSEVLGSHWTFETANKCKGVADITYHLSSEPMADEASAEAWLEKARDRFGLESALIKDGDKQSETAEDPVNWNQA